MGFLVGIDLVDTEDVRESLSDHGDRYRQRVYTPTELEACRVDADRLARVFAAKEATMKVLRCGEEPMPWRSIEVKPQGDGTWGLSLTGAAAEAARRRRVSELSLSLESRRGRAAAIVVAEVRA